MNECIECGSKRTIPAWEQEGDHGERPPDYIGCPNCSRMVRPHLLSEDESPPSQAKLTEGEVRRLSTGNQHSSALSVIEWQVVKGAAVEKGVSNWTDKVDGMLTVDENVGLLEKFATDGSGKTLREMKSPIHG